MDIKTLVKVASRAWCLTILAQLHRGVPGRQASLLAATGAGRTAFLQSLAHLVELGLVERNPGYGHPLRPEFRLTVRGAEFAGYANRIETLAKEQADQVLLRRAWTVPVLTASRQPCFFGEIKNRLPSITDRALSQSLKSLEAHRWLRRDIEAASRPARSRYLAINTGALIGEAAGL